MTMFNRPFQLDKANGRIMGVCAGLADYTGIEAVWLRLGLVAATLPGTGVPLLLYIIVGLIADRKPAF